MFNQARGVMAFCTRNLSWARCMCLYDWCGGHGVKASDTPDVAKMNVHPGGGRNGGGKGTIR